MNKYFAILLAIVALLPVSAGAAGAMTVVFEQNPLFGELDMSPGDSVSRTVTVTNGNTDSRDVYTGVNSTGNDGGLASGLTLSITSVQGTHWTGSLSDFFATSSVYLGNLAGGDNRIYTFTVTFNGPSDNSYQATTAGFDLLFGFNQVANNGGGGGGGNNDDDGGITTGGNANPGGTPQVAGASDSPSFIEYLINSLGGAIGGSVLGETVDAEATTTPEAEIFYPSAVEAAAEDEVDLCALWWLFALAWLVISAIAYWIGGQGRFAVVAPIIQLVFWIAALALLIVSLMFDIPCAWWPAVIVGVGAPVVYFLSGRPKDEMAML